MKGDFSRLRFQPKRHYTSVLQQQGRVQLDADGNEQRAIEEHLRHIGTRDVIGEDGAPIHDAGFAISVDAAGITIGAGRYYAGGLLCENEAALAYATQPYLVGVAPTIEVLLADLRAGRSSALEIWLEAWQRLATPIDDPALRETALGEADTTLRLQTVWRVRAVPLTGQLPQLTHLDAAIETLDCCTRMRRHSTLMMAPGKLAARTSEDPSQGACLPSPNAAYRGLENQLYRVEIHRGGTAGQATFKWSRENGSVATRITEVSGATLTLDSLGPDANLGFAPEQWVEITDDGDEFGSTPNRPGTLARIKSTDPAHLTVTLYQIPPSVDTANGHARLRRWEQDSATASELGVPCGANAWTELENGVEVRFSTDGVYAPGDHWLIPARTATGDIDWPPAGSDGETFQPPHRVTVHRAPLACIHYDAAKRAFVPQDCRRFFRPLIELGAAVTPPALHVTGISWTNDDVIPLDLLLFKGLSVTFDDAPSMPVDARNFVVSLEVPLSGEQFVHVLSMAGPTSRGAARSPVIVDGATHLTGTTLAWTAPRNVWPYLDTVLNEALAMAAQGLFARARVTLKSRAIAQGSGPTAAYLDGQCFTTPATRADNAARLDLLFPSGNGEKASDFESWFYVAPVQLIQSFTIAPSSVALVREPRGGTRVVDNSSNQGNAAAPAAHIVGTVALNYPALDETVIDLSLASRAMQSVLRFPETVKIPRGASEQSFTIEVVGNPGATATKFDITAAITAASGFHTSQTAELTVTGLPIIVHPIPGGTPGLLGPVTHPVVDPTKPSG